MSFGRLNLSEGWKKQFEPFFSLVLFSLLISGQPPHQFSSLLSLWVLSKPKLPAFPFWRDDHSLVLTTQRKEANSRLICPSLSCLSFFLPFFFLTFLSFLTFSRHSLFFTFKVSSGVLFSEAVFFDCFTECIKLPMFLPVQKWGKRKTGEKWREGERKEGESKNGTGKKFALWFPSHSFFVFTSPSGFFFLSKSLWPGSRHCYNSIRFTKREAFTITLVHSWAGKVRYEAKKERERKEREKRRVSEERKKWKRERFSFWIALHLFNGTIFLSNSKSLREERLKMSFLFSFLSTKKERHQRERKKRRKEAGSGQTAISSPMHSSILSGGPDGDRLGCHSSRLAPLSFLLLLSFLLFSLKILSLSV